MKWAAPETWLCTYPILTKDITSNYDTSNYLAPNISANQSRFNHVGCLKTDCLESDASEKSHKSGLRSLESYAKRGASPWYVGWHEK